MGALRAHGAKPMMITLLRPAPLRLMHRHMRLEFGMNPLDPASTLSHHVA
jgi:hypothetical protein